MNEPKHTPWHVAYLSNAWEIRESNGALITHIPGGKFDGDAKETAELIARAPSLLADNERLREALRKAYTELNIIRARDGVPYCHDGIKSDVCPEYFSSVVEECRIALSATERKE